MKLTSFHAIGGAVVSALASTFTFLLTHSDTIAALVPSKYAAIYGTAVAVGGAVLAAVSPAPSQPAQPTPAGK